MKSSSRKASPEISIESGEKKGSEAEDPLLECEVLRGGREAEERDRVLDQKREGLDRFGVELGDWWLLWLWW